MIVGLVGYLSFQSGRATVENLATELIHGTNHVITEHLNSYLSIPEKLGRINSDAVSRGILDLHDRDTARKYFWDQMQLYDLTYIGVGLTDGSGLGVGRFDGKNIIVEDWTSERDNNVSHFHVDDRGNIDKFLYTWTFRNDEETWYLNPIEAGHAIWSIVATPIVTGPYVVASSSRPIYDPAGELLGMFGSDIHLLKLGDFLGGLETSESGVTFITEKDGTLIGNSGKAQPFSIGEDESIQRLKAIQSEDLLIQEVSRAVRDRFSGFESLKKNVDFSIVLDNRLYFVNLKPWENELALEWIVGTVLPEDEFLTQIKANARRTVILCALALGVAIVVGLVTSRWIASPIVRLSEASMAMADGEFDRTIPQSTIVELDGLTVSFKDMAHRLKSSFIALAESNEKLEERVTERTAALEKTLRELHATQAQVIQSEKMSSLGQLVAGVAHEINNPVSFIHGNLSHAEEYFNDLIYLVRLYEQYYPDPCEDLQDGIQEVDWEFMQEDVPRLLSSMQVGTSRIREIVLSLRNFSRMDESAKKSVDIHEGLNSTLMILQHRLKAQPDRAEITLIKNYGQLPEVECYPGPLNQVFMNILSNAIDAIEESSTSAGTLIIKTEITPENCVRVTFEDNGVGIPESVRQRIFEPFFTTKSVGKGTGMGLSISHQIIVDRHEGAFRCTSQPGKGTKFTIEIPCSGVAKAA